MSNQFSITFGTFVNIEGLRLYINGRKCDFHVGGPDGDTDVTVYSDDGDGYYISLDEKVWFDSNAATNNSSGYIVDDNGKHIHCRFMVEQPLIIGQYKK